MNKNRRFFCTMSYLLSIFVTKIIDKALCHEKNFHIIPCLGVVVNDDGQGLRKNLLLKPFRVGENLQRPQPDGALLQQFGSFRHGGLLRCQHYGAY